ncbi:hypothetical protein ASD16_02625 [Cellulomonas sp. Root485]|uniref:Ig-like domain-containing protein n=1 Tax=Cellulomonas sp. Root485 TaxID=1736546 RepID=UPI0007138BF5|nr:Ig-like domain-containing protein [Cellulomonas sp. Root485]KQY24454.1 hypothetical protein ASD16_02625 [Cellulomonas sp. Root485]
MTRGRAGRAVAALASALVVMAGLVLVPSSAARADFASQCAAPDRTVAATDASIAVAAGETVLVDIGFQGGVDALPAGGTLCVAPGGSLTATYMNNAAGALVVAAGGTLGMPQVAVSAGFSLEIEGVATFAGLNVNGAADVHVAPSGELVVSGDVNPSAGTFTNEGTFRVEGGMNLNTAVVLENAGVLTVAGGATVNGLLANSGLATFSGGLIINGSGALQNTCAIDTVGNLINDSPDASNGGVVVVTGDLVNNGVWQQTQAAVTSAVGLTEDGSVSGFGGYRFTGTTSVQGSFVGDSSTEPIRVQTVAPAGQIFDVETGTIANVLRTTVEVPAVPECAGPPAPSSADVQTTKTGPASVLEGGTVSYVVTVRNAGPSDAADVVVSDSLPAGFALDPASTTGTLSGSTLTWVLGTVAVDQEVTLTFSGTATAPAGSLLLNVVRSTSSVPDPAPSNNDGSDGSSQVSTEVVAVPPPINVPPTADDLERETVTRRLVVGRVSATDPDVGQELTFTLVTGPANGFAYLSAAGGLVYVSDRDFAGIETFEYQVCDNASPTPGCDTATITVVVRPWATNDIAVTFADTPVSIPILSNDSAGAPLDATPVTVPANGTVTLDPATRRATYTPAAGFTGLDTFEYRICSPTVPSLCDTAQVTVLVVAPNLPPAVDSLLLTTSTDVPVTGVLVTSDPNPSDTLTTFRGIPPRSGSAAVEPSGSTTYAPRAGFAGRDSYGVIVCDDGIPVLCATGRVLVEVLPVAAPDTATTIAGTPVDIDIASNDRGLVGPATVTTAPARGAVTVAGGTARYAPEAGFVGTDTFEYTICATLEPDLCATTTVTVTVTAVPPPDPGPTPTPIPTPGGGGALAVTGADPLPALLLGVGLLLVGGCLVLLGRRRA